MPAVNPVIAGRRRGGTVLPLNRLRRRHGHIRDRLVRNGAIHGLALDAERLASYGCTDAEKSLAANYTLGDMMAFPRAYKSLGVEKG